MPKRSFLRHSTWTFLVLAVAGASRCGSYVRRHLEKGDSYFEQRKYRDALAEYVRAIRLDSDNPRGIRQLGLAHYQLGEFQEAYIYLSKAVILRPTDDEVRVKLGSIYVLGRRFGEAMREADAVLATEPTNLDALGLLGSIYLAKPDPRNAADVYRRMIKSAPSNPRGHYMLGVSLLMQKNYGGAKDEFATVLSLSPAELEATARLVQISLSEKRPDDALALVTKQINISGKSAPLMIVLGGVQLARGKRELAEAAYLEAIGLDRRAVDLRAKVLNVDARLSLAHLYEIWGKLDQALATLDDVVKLDPKNSGAFLMLGSAYQRKGDVLNARRSYEQALFINPHNAGAANNLAWLLAENFGETYKALQYAQRAKQEAPDDPQIADTFGWILFKTGDYKRALSLLSESATKLPDNPVVQYHLGVASQRAGDLAAARQAFRRAVKSPESFLGKDGARKALAALK